jgi:hypothetical protein
MSLTIFVPHHLISRGVVFVVSVCVVCFFVFDQDKHGYFETPELKLLMNILHKVPDGETVKVSE